MLLSEELGEVLIDGDTEGINDGWPNVLGKSDGRPDKLGRSLGIELGVTLGLLSIINIS